MILGAIFMRNYDILFDRTERNIHFIKADCMKNYNNNFLNMDFNQNPKPIERSSDQDKTINSINLQNELKNEVDNSNISITQQKEPPNLQNDSKKEIDNSNFSITQQKEDPKNLSNNSSEINQSANNSMENNDTNENITNITNEKNISNDTFTIKEIKNIDESGSSSDNQSK